MKGMSRSVSVVRIALALCAAAAALQGGGRASAQGHAVLHVSAVVRPSCVVRVDQPSENDQLPRLSLRCGRESLATVRMTMGPERLAAPWWPDDGPEGTWLVPLAANPVASLDLQSLPSDTGPPQDVVVTINF